MPAAKPMTKKRKAAIVADLEAGMTIDKIMKKHHIGYDRLTAIRKEYGLHRRHGRECEVDEFAYEYDLRQEWDRVRFMVLAGLGVK